jgi:hypothetical protein
VLFVADVVVVISVVVVVVIADVNYIINTDINIEILLIGFPSPMMKHTV